MCVCMLYVSALWSTERRFAVKVTMYIIALPMTDVQESMEFLHKLSIWIFWFEYCPLHYTPFGGFHSTMCTFFSACTSKRGCYGDTTCAIFASLHNLNNNLGNRMRVSLLDICWVWMAIYVDIQLFCIEAHAYFLWRQFWYPYMEAGIHIRMEATIHWLQLQTNIPLTLTIKCELQKT